MCQRLQQGTVDEDEDCGPDSETGSWKSFAAMSEEQKVAATSCTVAWGKGEGERVDWEFQSKTERVDLGHLPAEKNLPCPIDADNINLDGDLSANFFKNFLPDIKGHGKRADKCLSDKRAGFHGTYESRADFKVESDGPDPDAKIKLVYQLLIAGATEGVSGTLNMWKKGTSGGRKTYPDFGRYMKLQEFQMIASCLPHLFAEEKHWCRKVGEAPWDVFMPILASCHAKRRQFIKVFFLMLDESMSGWRPKTSKLGGLPNCTFEPRKPVPLGTMLRNGVEAITGILVCQDPSIPIELQRAKKCQGTQSCSPSGRTINAGEAEAMRQAEGAQVQPGGWVGGDA